RSRAAQAAAGQRAHAHAHGAAPGVEAEGARWPWETRVGIVTNSDDRVPGILESFGLRIGPGRCADPGGGGEAEPHGGVASGEGDEDGSGFDVDFVALSYDVGVEKPDRRIFDAARELFLSSLGEGDGQAWRS